MAPRWKTIAIAGWSFGCLAMIGVNAAQERMEIRGNIKLFGDGSGLIVPGGSKQTTAVASQSPSRRLQWFSPGCAYVWVLDVSHEL